MTTPANTPEPTPESLKVRRYSRLFVWTMVAAWFLSLAPMIYRIGMLPLALLAVTLGVLAFWSTFGVPNMTSLRIMLGLGGVGAGAFVLMGIAWLAIAPEIIALDSCSQSSLTPQGDLVCQQEFRDAVEQQYGIVLP